MSSALVLALLAGSASIAWQAHGPAPGHAAPGGEGLPCWRLQRRRPACPAASPVMARPPPDPLLDRSAARIDEQFADDPTCASSCCTAADVYRELGEAGDL